MTIDRNEQIREIFAAALECNPSEREAILAKACAGDTSLKEEVESLLTAYEEAPGFLEKLEELKSEIDHDSPVMTDEGFGLPFERLGDFRLIRRLGEGGMGVVYLAMQEPMNRQVALKVLRPERMGSLEAEARFKREVKAIAGLRHPRIVTVVGSGEDKGLHYFAMERVPGKSLDVLLREAGARNAKAPLDKVLGWIRDIALALECAHQAGIIHRDVKPSNIRITPDGRAMLMDFGVARLERLSTMTLTGEFCGTPRYASPEQIRARHRAIDARTDIYSLGVTLYESVTGRMPFEGETTEQIFRKILEEEPMPPRRMDPSISRELNTVILKALEKNPKWRYRTMADFAADLERLLAGQSVSARPAGVMRKSQKWIRRHKLISLAGAAALLVLATVAVLVLLVFQQRQEALQNAMNRFKPAKEALEWPEFLTQANPWMWCLEADPQDPSAYMLRAIIDIESNALDLAAANLEECIRKCAGNGEDGLEKDAHYLLVLIKLEEAQRSPERNRLLEEAEHELQEAGAFDPLTPQAFVLRAANPLSSALDRERTDLHNLKLNQEHFLVHLYIGLSLFHDLYKGGTIGKFEKAIEHFNEVLKTHPDNIMALTFLGRTYYFFARFYNFLDLTKQAEDCLVKAIAASGNEPYHLIYTTLGGVWLLRGDNDKACDAFHEALEVGEGKLHIHNALAGIGKVYARQGRFDEALEMYSEGLKREKSDIHIRVAIAGIHMQRGEIDKALETVGKILAMHALSPRFHVASVYLLCALAHLEKEMYPEAINALEKIESFSIHSPHDLSLACLIITTLPEEQHKNLAGLATKLAGMASYNARFEDRDSPISLSALGAAAYLNGEYQKAVEYFKKAKAERKGWPQDTREYYWSEDVRDQYFLAMTHFKLSHGTGDKNAEVETAQKIFVQAEKEYKTIKLPIESAAIIKRVRNKAMEILGKAE